MTEEKRYQSYYYCLLVVLTTLFLNTSVFAQEQFKKNASVELISQYKRVDSSTASVTVGIVFTLREGWHIYWLNPGDSGEAAKISWGGVDNLKVKDIQWPVPKSIAFGPLVNYGYENQVTLLQELILPSNAISQQKVLQANIDVLVCAEDCIPERHVVKLQLRNVNNASAIAQITQAGKRLPEKTNLKGAYRLEGKNLVLQLSPQQHPVLSDLKNVEKIDLYFAKQGLVEPSAKVELDGIGSVFTIKQKAGVLTPKQVGASDLVIAYTNSLGERTGVQLKAQPIIDALAGTLEKQQTVGYLVAIMFAFIGGLLLNLMPCVFPILSIKALSLLKLSNQQQKLARRQGVLYCAGVVSSLLAVASVLIILKAGGASIGWGFHLQNPIIICLLIYLIFIIGLNLSGYFEISDIFSNFSNSFVSQSQSSSYLAGVLTTVVATPCTAPFMATAIGYALLQPFYITLSVFTAMGLGLAAPYLTICYFPVLRSWLPKPGLWMVKFKELLAFPMFLTAIWLIWVLSLQVGTDIVFSLLIGLLAICFSLWLYNIETRYKFIKAFAVAVLLLSFLPIYSIKAGKINTQSLEFSQQLLERSLASKKAVFVNMTAAWCITCKFNEQIVLSTSVTKQLFAGNKVVYLKGDWTNYNAEITKYLEGFGRNGVPIYVFYDKPNEISGKRPKPIVLPQILTQATITELFDN